MRQFPSSFLCYNILHREIRRMIINKQLIKAILNQLDEIYPARVTHQDYIVKDHNNRKEVADHLFYLKDKGFIEFKDWSSLTNQAEGEVRIVMPEGKNYLKSLS